MRYQLPASLGEQIYLVGQMENKYILTKLKELQLTADTATIISFVNDHPGTRQKEINQALNKQAATVTNMIKRLEKRNLMIRRVDPENSREKQCFLLKDGLEIVDKIDQSTADVNALLKPCVLPTGEVNIQQFFQALLEALRELGVAE
ncbi:MarR family winged helix-turn-helix transcriptional regulator [Limosilactobacillus sp.]|jgi:DNA-binding MarR family transcriptional regulator|uniref:MarR family winged helix-turn-helix transcriptional regulator n=1 Tax=Limosilactobacillus sp. TaxID=2773925 RepID=UPI0025C36213|nr:MarR family transcriptional regulator [Limosilactobacillus sp.]MCH3921624.1 MarR family transcriptional regulator [Limosilactobacillus sp.]MCH3928395.1 MarR family transcriptional regulator [Limosilactobacillus sp.]